MSRKTQTSRWGQLLLGIAVAAPLAIASAIAAPPVTGLPASAQLVSDEDLGDMRGRYIALEQLNFFGIQMVSMWQTGDGSVLTTSLEFEVDLVDPNPLNDNDVERVFDPDASLWANWSHIGCDTGCDASLNLGNTDVPEGLNSVSGAVQSTEISGDDNDVVNLLRVRIGDYNADSVGYEGDGVISQKIEMAGLTVPFGDGFVVTFQKGLNSLGMILQGPGVNDDRRAEGRAVQSLNGGAVNQIAQHVQLIGDANAIQNSLDIVIGLEPSAAQQLAIENALSAMKGWGF
jgi:hypothetical protein